ncbi:hypothetical protein KC345_g4789 [Hortaea werneckii]|nr:hypothetical protein KC345_g4789 [Hortaea werneckii]
MVRGQVTTARDGEKGKAYAELVAENEKLRRSLSQVVGGSMSALWSQNAILSRHSRSAEEALFDATASRKRDDTMSWDQITVPTKSVSDSLIAHDEVWNSWVHYATNHQAFATQHDAFFAERKEGRALQTTQPSWLALYFSVLSVGLLTMTDEEAMLLNLGIYGESSTSLPLVTSRLTQAKDSYNAAKGWYDAAIFCLEQANFLRSNDIRTVQAVAVLGMAFVNFGDHDLYPVLWRQAINTARRLGLHQSAAVQPISWQEECQRRLWWTLTICDWLPMPGVMPVLLACDFDVPLPSRFAGETEDNSNGVTLHRVDYHIFMARVAIVYHEFREGLATHSPADATDCQVEQKSMPWSVNILGCTCRE